MRGTVMGSTHQHDWSGGIGKDRRYLEVVRDDGTRFMFPFEEYRSILFPGDRVEIEFVEGSNGMVYRPRKVTDEIECAECFKRFPEAQAFFNSDKEPICIDCHDRIVMAAEARMEGDR